MVERKRQNAPSSANIFRVSGLFMLPFLSELPTDCIRLISVFIVSFYYQEDIVWQASDPDPKPGHMPGCHANLI
jgi:hypothetical protein